MTTPELSDSQLSTERSGAQRRPDLSGNSQPPLPARRRRGKVARLPKTTRERLNRKLLDGIPYRDLIAQLGLGAWGLTEDNLCTWKTGGYQDWLRDHQWLAQARAQTCLATELAGQVDPVAVHQANLQLVLSQLRDGLSQSGSRLLQADPQVYLRLLTQLCRLTHVALEYEKYRQTSRSARMGEPTKPQPINIKNNPDPTGANRSLKNLALLPTTAAPVNSLTH